MYDLLKGLPYKYRKQLFLLYFVLVLESVLLIVLPQLLERILSEPDTSGMWGIFCFFLLSLVCLAANIVKRYADDALVNRISNDMTASSVNELLHAPLEKLYCLDRVNAIHTVNNLVYYVSNYYLSILPTMTVVLVRSLVAFLLLWRVHIIFALVAAFATALHFVLKVYMHRREADALKSAASGQFDFYQDVHEVFNNVKSVLIHSAQYQIQNRFRHTMSDLMKKYDKYAFWGSGNRTESLFFSKAMYLCAVVLVCMMIQRELVEIGMYEVLVSYTLSLISGVDYYLGDVRGFRAQMKAMYQLYSNVRLEREENGELFENRITSVSFQDVSFGYDKEKRILSRFNFAFERGRLYLIKGANGKGKSLLINLLCGLLVPDEGDICVNGKSLKAWDKYRFLGEHVAICDQRTVLFFDRLSDNVTLSCEGDEKPFLQLVAAEGIEENEDNSYSGGELQKIGLARMLYICDRFDSDILILDEPLNHLDEKAKTNLINHINALKQSHIIIVIDHRGGFDAISDSVINL